MSLSMQDEQLLEYAEGKRFHVRVTDGEEMTVEIVKVHKIDRLFVYDVLWSNRTTECPIGHVLKFEQIDCIQPASC
jgi:hypothetical protein